MMRVRELEASLESGGEGRSEGQRVGDQTLSFLPQGSLIHFFQMAKLSHRFKFLFENRLEISLTGSLKIRIVSYSGLSN